MKRSVQMAMQRIQLAILPIMLVVLGVLHHWLGANVPRSRMMPVEVAFVAVIIWRVGSVVVIRRRRDIGNDLPGDWYANSLAGFWLVAVFSVIAFWVTMPFASPAQQLLAVLAAQLPVAIAATGTVKHPDYGGRSWRGTYVPVVVPAGISAYFVYFGGAFATPIIVNLALFCGLQVLMRELLQASMIEAWLAEAEAAAQRDARTRFLASASHDLGQPLHSARLFFDQAVRGADPARRAVAVKHAEAAFDTVERQLDHMNSYMRLEAGGVMPQLRPVVVGPLLAEVAARAALSSPSGLVVKVVPSRLTVRADHDLLERALSNLVENTFRHAQATRLLIGARRELGRIKLWVIDDGAGVADTDMPTLFDDYVRGSNHGDEQRGGFGLGLASVRRIAGLFGGSAGIDPRWHSGAAFFIDLTPETSLFDG